MHRKASKTDKPAPLSIDQGEWRALLLKTFSAHRQLRSVRSTPESLKALHTHLDRSKQIAC
jgi:hypothetical protein